MHLHFPQKILIDHVIGIDELKIVEFDVDFEKRIQELIPSLKKIQQAGKRLIIDGYISWDVFMKIVNSLDYRGLEFHIKRMTLPEAKEFTDRFYEYFGG